MHTIRSLPMIGGTEMEDGDVKPQHETCWVQAVALIFLQTKGQCKAQPSSGCMNVAAFSYLARPCILITSFDDIRRA